MLYKPMKERLWDTWIVNEEKKYFLFYIRVSENGSRWDGISLAISDDLIHWHEQGTVLEKDKDAIWLGTGMITKFKEYYIMNYSQEKPIGKQKIYFAKSVDLIHWEKIQDVNFEPDGDIYMKNNNQIADAYPRWDSLGIVDALKLDRELPFYAFLTSDSSKFELQQKRGVLGFCKSDDGIHWKHLKPATIRKDIVPAFEVPEHIELNGNHYVIFCTSSKLGYRFDSRSKYLSGGTYYVYSDRFEGPYDFTDYDPMLVGSRDVDNVTMGSVGRVIYENGKVLFYHIWGNQEADGWLGLVKELKEVKKGELQLFYYNNNDLLKNKLNKKTLKELNFKQTKKIGNLAPVLWEIEKNTVNFYNLGSSGILLCDDIGLIDNENLLGDGIFIEGEMIINSGLGAGIVLETKSNQKICVFINLKDKTLDFCKVVDGFCSNLVLEGIMSKSDKELHKRKYKFKVLSRKFFIEVYLNDKYISGLRLTEELKNQKIGFYVEDSSGTISNFHIYQMK